MAGTLKLTDIAHSSGAGTITVDSLATLSVSTGKLLVGGSSVEAGSTNILRKTTDYTILEADVSGKSELVIAANAASSNRTITLPAVATSGLANCIVTIICDTDATSTYELKIQDIGTTEVWTGYQKGDFVRLVVSNSAWLVVDHKETYYSRRYMTSDLAMAVSAVTKITAWTNVLEIGNAWDNSSNQLVTPTGMNGYWTLTLNNAGTAGDNGCVPQINIGGTTVALCAPFSDGSAGSWGGMGITGKYKATSTQVVEFYCKNARSNVTHTLAGGAVSETHFIAQFERVY